MVMLYAHAVKNTQFDLGCNAGATEMLLMYQMVDLNSMF